MLLMIIAALNDQSGFYMLVTCLKRRPLFTLESCMVFVLYVLCVLFCIIILHVEWPYCMVLNITLNCIFVECGV